MVTSNYGFFLPTGPGSMSDVKKNVTDSFKIIEPRNNITALAAGVALPQTGNYQIGDRVFREDLPVSSSAGKYPSNYILIVKDVNWGWHWRPIQHVISPWVDVPAGAIELAGWSIHPTSKLQIALDSKGMCHWRGTIRNGTGGLPSTTTQIILKELPDGLKPNANFMYTLAITPPTGSAAGIAGYVGGRMFMKNDGTTSFRFFNANNFVSRDVWFDGLSYDNSSGYYYGP